MSDAAPAQRAMEAALAACTGGPGCPCGGEPSGSPSLPALPSRSSSSPPGSPSRSSSSPPASSSFHDNSGNSTADTAMEVSNESEGLSDAAIPVGVPVQDWSGLRTIRVVKCEHGRWAIMKKCWGGKDTGRRFLGCPVKDVKQQCDFVKWLDEPWPERVQASFKKLWRELRVTRDVQAAGHNALIEAYKVYEESNKDKEKLKEAVDRTKRVAEMVCNSYQRRARYATVDKSKLMYLVYCLLAIIFFLVAVIIVKK